MRDLVACTIVSKNYLPFARVLARSFLRHHPGSRFVVCLVDRIDGAFDPAGEPFEVVEAETLPIEDFTDFCFKYTILELNTAVKPAFLRRLFERPDAAPKLVYFDPDIVVYRRLDELSALLDRHAVVLTPHLDRPIEDDLLPGEVQILQSGSYNLGFLALSGAERSLPLLEWWHRRVYDRCVVDVPKGLFVDQKWMDLVPGLHDGVHVLRDPGYNVAYWNLHGRNVEGSLDDPRCNGRPLVFFHFSGVDPEALGRVSKHQNRFTLGDVGGARALYEDYRDRLLAAGYRETRAWPYAWAAFDNGVAIPDVARSFYHSLGRSRRRFGDPFRIGPGSFFEWLNAPVKPGAALSHLLHHIYRSRDDLLLGFPDPLGRDAGRFVDWLVEGGRRDYRLDPVFMEPVAGVAPPAGAAAGEPPRRASMASGARGLARRLYRSDTARALKHRVKRTLGETRAQAIKRRLRPQAPSDDRPGRGVIADRVDDLAVVRLGVNLCGYFTAESGMGQGVRGIARAFERAGIPSTLANLELGVASRTGDRSFQDFADTFEHDVNLFFVNADQVPHVAEHLGHEKFRRKVNVGFWLWELERFPERWLSSFEPFHEIWTPSSFCAGAIGSVAPIPVRRVPLAVEPRPPQPQALSALRRRLEIDDERFTFLFTFDYLSYPERKNPAGLIRAFRRAFRPDEPVRLLLKTINREQDPGAAEALRSAAGDWPVTFFDRYLAREEVDLLAAAADCYVSLHRSEGFGLTLAEAMAAGTPVVATDYAASVDFLGVGEGYPVRYRLVELERDHGPYPAGAVWAEPDEEHAAEQMRRVYERREEAAAMARRGRERVARELGLDAVARVLRERMRTLVRRVNGPRGESFGL
jgi:glycosyltransferase involved in cell wall biosynthesis